MLVGYKKTFASPNVHSKMIENPLELGTFSPLPASDGGVRTIPMSNSVSLPILERDWIRGNDANQPEYMQVARRSLRAKKKKGKRSIITVDFGGSDPDICVEDSPAEAEAEEVPPRLKRALTDPTRHASRRRDIAGAYTRDSRIEQSSMSSCVHTSTPVTGNASNQSSISCDNSSISKPYHVDNLSQDNKTESVKKQLDFRDEIHRNLSQCLTKALGDEGELHDSDKSDDDSCVQNGYDEFLEPAGDCSNAHNTVVVTSDSICSNDNNRTDRTDSKHTGLTVRDILKNNAMQLTSPGTSKANNGRASTGNSVTSSANSVQITYSRDSVDSGVGRTMSGSDSQASTSDLHQSGSNGVSGGGVVTQGSFRGQSQGGRDQVTVIELLKEEYKRSSMFVPMPDLTTDVSDLSDSGVSGMSVKTSHHKASSDSNLLHSMEELQVQWFPPPHLLGSRAGALWNGKTHLIKI